MQYNSAFYCVVPWFLEHGQNRGDSTSLFENIPVVFVPPPAKLCLRTILPSNMSCSLVNLCSPSCPYGLFSQEHFPQIAQCELFRNWLLSLGIMVLKVHLCFVAEVSHYFIPF